MSVSKITEKGFTIQFDKDKARILDSNKKTVAIANNVNGIYKIVTENLGQQKVYTVKSKDF